MLYTLTIHDVMMNFDKMYYLELDQIRHKKLKDMIKYILCFKLKIINIQFWLAILPTFPMIKRL